jgi:hypothetical protein
MAWDRTVDEKRKFERFNVNVPARVEIIPQEGTREKFDLETIDLSAEGTYLKSGSPLQEGSQVSVEIFLNFDQLKCPDDPEGSLIIRATGRVLRSGGEGTVIHFNHDYSIKTCLDSLRKDDAN